MADSLDERLACLTSSVDPDELIDVGCDLADVDRQGDAERCFRRAAELGSTVALFNLGNTLVAQRRWDAGRPGATWGRASGARPPVLARPAPPAGPVQRRLFE